MSLGEALPPVNATLNGLSAVLLLAGWRAIRAGDRRRHRALVLSALGASALCLVGYLTRVALTGTHRFPGSGALKTAYLLLLGSHTLLAAVALPLILRALWLAWKGRFPEHRRVARIAFPVWLYVSATGVLVYLMLYQLAPRLG
jgi:putative membrane protein